LISLKSYKILFYEFNCGTFQVFVRKLRPKVIHKMDCRAMNGEDVSISSVVKSAGVGLVCGGIGGASGQLANAASKGFSSGVARNGFY
jgi:hypothetical protein